MFESIMRNSWNESVIQVLPARFGTKRRKLPPKRHKLSPKRRKSKQSELCQGFMSKTITVCILSWVHTEQVVQKIGSQEYFLWASRMLHAESRITLNMLNPIWRSNNASNSLDRGCDNIENTETVLLFFCKRSFFQQSSEILLDWRTGHKIHRWRVCIYTYIYISYLNHTHNYPCIMHIYIYICLLK